MTSSPEEGAELLPGDWAGGEGAWPHMARPGLTPVSSLSARPLWPAGTGRREACQGTGGQLLQAQDPQVLVPLGRPAGLWRAGLQGPGEASGRDRFRTDAQGAGEGREQGRAGDLRSSLCLTRPAPSSVGRKRTVSPWVTRRPPVRKGHPRHRCVPQDRSPEGTAEPEPLTVVAVPKDHYSDSTDPAGVAGKAPTS